MGIIINFNDIKKLGEKLHLQNKKIVLVGGCFDLLHFGHFHFLQKAKEQGDILVVLLESDKRIRTLKGLSRPLHSMQERAFMLSSLRFVDYVIQLPDTMSDQDYENVTKILQPAIIATTRGSKASAYIEKQAKEIGASLYVADLVENLSTSNIFDLLEKEKNL